jgi:bifunctional non-homologous end joining protein LigD
LHRNGRDLRELPLLERRLRVSESFDDGIELLKVADRMGLEGIVSNRLDAPYRSGRRAEWIKVNSASWREANRERRRLFERARQWRDWAGT